MKSVTACGSFRLRAASPQVFTFLLCKRVGVSVDPNFNVAVLIVLLYADGTLLTSDAKSGVIICVLYLNKTEKGTRPAHNSLPSVISLCRLIRDINSAN